MVERFWEIDEPDVAPITFTENGQVKPVMRQSASVTIKVVFQFHCRSEIPWVRSGFRVLERSPFVDFKILNVSYNKMNCFMRHTINS